MTRKLTVREIVEEAIESLPWTDRERIRQKMAEEEIKLRPPITPGIVEELVKKVIAENREPNHNVRAVCRECGRFGWLRHGQCGYCNDNSLNPGDRE